MIDQNVLETMTKTLTKLTLTENVVKNGLEALQKISSFSKHKIIKNFIIFIKKGHPQAKSALISRNIVKDIVALLEKKSYSPIVVHSGLKLLESIARTKEGVEYLKKDGLGMRAMVTLLEKHPEERAILNIGASILGKIATIEDLDNALNSLKSGGLIIFLIFHHFFRFCNFSYVSLIFLNFDENLKNFQTSIIFF